jgi:hypothetical protein
MSIETKTIIVPELEAEAKRLSIPQDIASTIVASFAPHMAKFSETITGIENIEPTMPKSAREMRLNIVKIRTAADKTRQELKAESLLRGRAIDGMAALITLRCKENETKLEAIEKAEERRLAEEKEKLRQKRATALAEFVDDVSIYPVAEMTEPQFASLLSGQKLAHEAKLSAIKKAEEDRLAAEKAAADAEAKRQEEARIAEIQRRADEAKERARLEAEAAEQKKLRDAAEAQAKVEREAREAAEAKAKAEREEAQRKQDEEQRIAKEKQDALQKQIDEQKRKEQAAKDAENKRIADAKAVEEKRLADEKEAARKAAAAPDKEKLKDFARRILEVELPTLTTSPELSATIKEQVSKLVRWIEGQAAKL